MSGKKSVVAESVPFDNNPNGTPIFTQSSPENVQEAISAGGEKAQTALDTPRYSIPLIYNGTVGNNTFIGYSNLVPGDDTPILIPVKSTLIEFSFSNANANASYTLEFRKGSTTATPFASISKTNTKNFVDNSIDQEFLAGEEIYIKYIDDGTNASDVGLVLFFKAVPE